MKISGVDSSKNAAQTQQSQVQNEDSETKRIKEQIAAVQKQLQALGENDKMDMEEKMKKKQELNKEISMLNQQLRQHQIELRRQQQNSEPMEEMLGQQRGSQQDGKTATGTKTAGGLSQSGMKAMISADSAVSQAAVYEQVASDMDGRSRVIKGEIKQDGGSSALKENELASVEQKASAAQGAQGRTLSETQKELQEAAKEDAAKDKEEKSSKEAENAQQEENAPVYTPIDIML